MTPCSDCDAPSNCQRFGACSIQRTRELREGHARAMEWASRGRGIADQAEMMAVSGLFPKFWLWVALRVRRRADNVEKRWRDEARKTYYNRK